MGIARITAAVLVLGGCSGGGDVPDSGAPDRGQTHEVSVADSTRPDAAGADAAGGPSCLGTKYPGKATIDPDNPDFEDGLWTKTEVQQKFAAAKAQDLPAYRAYKAAQKASGVLPCAFCPCGCAASDGHLSAIDCFKDMHGFG